MHLPCEKSTLTLDLLIRGYPNEDDEARGDRDEHRAVVQWTPPEHQISFPAFPNVPVYDPPLKAVQAEANLLSAQNEKGRDQGNEENAEEGESLVQRAAGSNRLQERGLAAVLVVEPHWDVFKNVVF